MKFDNLGLPQIQGADDLQDSAMFAGMLVTFNWPQEIPLRLYVVSKGKYVRHPREPKYTFSRDQTIPLFSGLKTQKMSALVDPDYNTEGDFVDPSVRGHFKRCANVRPSNFEDWFMWGSVLWHIHLNKDHESNQLFCMLWMHRDQKYLKYFCDNYDWKKSIRDYYAGWRNEPEFGEHMIKQIKGRLNGRSDSTTQTLT